MPPIDIRGTPRTPVAMNLNDPELAKWTSRGGIRWLRALLASTPYPTEE
jgi:hypothetical protein